MEIIWFAIGYLLGSSPKGSNPFHNTESQYALFVADSETEALEKLTQAYQSLDKQPPDLSFDTAGKLEAKFPDYYSKANPLESYRSGITIDRFTNECLLKIKLTKKRDSVPIGINIMLARYLANNVEK